MDSERIQTSDDQVDELRMALIRKQTPWFISESRNRYHGIVSYVMERMSARSGSIGSIASFLFFGATLLDISGEPVGRSRMMPEGDNEWINELNRIWTLKRSSRSIDIDREAERERLIHIGVDDETAEILARWISDSSFQFIRYKVRRPSTQVAKGLSGSSLSIYWTGPRDFVDRRMLPPCSRRSTAFSYSSKYLSSISLLGTTPLAIASLIAGKSSPGRTPRRPRTT